MQFISSDLVTSQLELIINLICTGQDLYSVNLQNEGFLEEGEAMLIFNPRRMREG